jgi:general secretion pathway protein D|tara:strand:+ start:36505 stop:38475 length:1971 start_codon:yes stop_codon:yes gene_type:complete
MDDIVTIGTLVDNGTNELLQQIQILTGKPILRQQNLPSVKISFDQGDKAMTRRQLIRALESLLSLNGIALTRVGVDFIKAVPAAAINNQVPILWEGSTIGAEATQMIYEKVFKLDFLTTVEVVPLIQPIMSQGSPISLEKSGLLLVTDALVNLQRIERILKAIDQPTDDSIEILFFHLKHIDVQEASQRLKQMQAGALRRRLQTNTNFDADERTNQLIVFTHKANTSLITNLIEKMDIDVAPLTTTKLFSIRYAEAVEVVSIIDQVISGQKEARDQNTGGNNNAQAARQAQQQRAANAAAAAVRAEASNLQFSDYLTLVADERANSIVASGTQSDINALNSLIDEIDVLLAQVRIEVVIAEVTLGENYSRGIDSLGFQDNVTAQYDNITGTDGDSIGLGTTFPGSNSVIDIGSTAFTLGSPLILGGGEQYINLILDKGRTNTDVRILSAPTILTTHNREASISVGDSIPVITQNIQTDNDVNSNSIRQSVQYRDTGIELNVTPLIGSDGIVQLEVEQTIENALDGDTEGNPTITRRNAKSYVSVANGDVVILGGLQSSTVTNSESRIFLLGDIPVVGKLFRSYSDKNSTTDLLIFIRPIVLSTTSEAQIDATDKLSKISGGDEVKGFFENGTFQEEEDDEATDAEDKAKVKRSSHR